MPGHRQKEQQDQAHPPRPSAELPRRFAVIARGHRPLGEDRSPGPEHGADHPEAPGVVDDDHPDPEAENHRHRRGEQRRPMTRRLPTNQATGSGSPSRSRHLPWLADRVPKLRRITFRRYPFLLSSHYCRRIQSAAGPRGPRWGGASLRRARAWARPRQRTWDVSFNRVPSSFRDPGDTNRRISWPGGSRVRGPCSISAGAPTGPWGNGSPTDSGSVSPSSNLGGPAMQRR
jgi:hypothetical protein